MELIYGPFISRKQAKEQGLAYYFTGKPCKHGHVSVRQTSKGVCEECHRLHRTSERTRAVNRKRYAKNMKDPEFRKAKSADSRKHYHNVMKHDAERMRLIAARLTPRPTEIYATRQPEHTEKEILVMTVFMLLRAVIKHTDLGSL